MRVFCFLLMAAFALTGCGSAEPDPAASGTPASGNPRSAVSGGRPDMVAAVSASKTPGAAEVRFALSGRPTVGQPVDIQLALTPTVELDRLYARFQGSEGLDLVKGGETAHYEQPSRGKELSHTVTVIPRSDGIFNVTAVVLSDSDTESIARTYTIPIIAGAGLPELPPPEAEARPQSKPARP
jgi:hypothetical protein